MIFPNFYLELYKIIKIIILNFFKIIFLGRYNWGLGIGDWGLGLGAITQYPIPK